MARRFAGYLAALTLGVVLAIGLPLLAAELSDWSITAASNNSAPPNGWPEGMNYSEVNDSARENMAVLARWHQDTNGSLVSGGTSAAYTLTPNRTITAYAQGLRFAFELSATNAASATLNVSSVGALPLLRPDGTAVIAGDLPLGSIAEVVHDGAGSWRVVGLVPDDLSRDTVTALSATAMSLASTGHPLQIGTSAGTNLAADTANLQARNAGVTSTFNLNPLGGTVIVGQQSANSDAVITANLLTIVEGGAAQALTIRNRTDGDPAKGSAQAILLAMTRASGTTIAELGFSTADLALEAHNDGGGVLLQADDAASGQVTLFDGDPDEGVILWRHLLEFEAQSGNYQLVLADGGKVVLSDGSAANQITVPPNSTAAFPIGSQVRVCNDGSGGANDTTIVQGSGVTVSGSGLTVGNKRCALLIKVATNTWMVSHG